MPSSIIQQWDVVLGEFQAAEAQFGDEEFYLFAVTEKEGEKNREILAREAGRVGFVPTAHLDEENHLPGWIIFGSLYGIRGREEVRDEAPYKLFMEIAKRAGTMLPLTVREQIQQQVEAPYAPAAWWVTFMWQIKPPIEEFLRSSQKFGRMIWVQPFRDAADAIEREGLCTPGSSRPHKRLLMLLRCLLESLGYFERNVRASGSGIVPSPDSVRETAGLLSSIGQGAFARRLTEHHEEIIKSEAFNLSRINGALTLDLVGSPSPDDVRRDTILALVERGKQMADFVRELIDQLETKIAMASEAPPEMARSGGESDQGPAAVESERTESPAWQTPNGYVGTLTITTDTRFRKKDKNPPRTTIDTWINRATRDKTMPAIKRAPDSGEVFLPEDWVHEQIITWSPRRRAEEP